MKIGVGDIDVGVAKPSSFANIKTF